MIAIFAGVIVKPALSRPGIDLGWIHPNQQCRGELVSLVNPLTDVQISAPPAMPAVAVS